METLKIVLKLVTMGLEIYKMIQAHRLTEQATDEMLADLQTTANYLVTRSKLARAEVKDTDEAIISDSFNRD